MTNKTIHELMQTLPQIGKLEWIGVRPDRGEPMLTSDSAEVLIGTGITGDRFRGNAKSKRQVTLFQWEYIDVIKRLTGSDAITPDVFRRNLIVSGINLNALKDQVFVIGNVVLKGTGYCHPCSKMERFLGDGGYNIMRGHGGITAQVITPGIIHLGDSVKHEVVTEKN